MSRCIEYQEMIRAGNWLEAAKALDEELTRDPGYTGAYYNLGLAFLAGGMHNLAKALFEYYTANYPDGYWAEKARAAITGL